MQLKRAQVLLNEEFLESAETIEPSIEQQMLPQREQGQHEELKERLKERHAQMIYFSFFQNLKAVVTIRMCLIQLTPC
jgi:amino acid permease